eukprot:12927651-Prorocentrum_lima.AAC.1
MNPINTEIKSVPITNKEVFESQGEAMNEWKASARKELYNFAGLEDVQDTTQGMVRPPRTTLACMM